MFVYEEIATNQMDSR